MSSEVSPKAEYVQNSPEVSLITEATIRFRAGGLGVCDVFSVGVALSRYRTPCFRLVSGPLLLQMREEEEAELWLHPSGKGR